jgi:DNA-binding PadR family transcriptional regulator
MGPGTLYGTINRLLEAGLIEETTTGAEPGDERRRRYYRLTATGQQVAQAELDRLQALVRRLARPRRLGLATNS